MIVIEALKNLKWYFKNKANRKYYNYTEDYFRKELADWFKTSTGIPLDLDSPKRFNEKIQWLKLYDSTPLKAKLADKLAVREFVSKTIGNQYLIPLLGGVKRFDDLNFGQLPNQFVLKTNHASSTNIIVKDKSKFNALEAKLKFSRWLSTNYAFKMGLELHYGMISPMIVCEKYMGDNLSDYKFFCFGGNPEFIWVDVDRYQGHKRNVYDIDWKELPFTIDKFERVDIERPQNLELMIELARKLSANFAFVRVDFYEIDGKVYFGEMTFTSSSGRDPFNPDEYDFIYGEKIVLPKKSPIPIKEIQNTWEKK